MATEFQGGIFKVSFKNGGSGHPLFLDIITGDNVRMTINHREIVDLQFALERAKQEAIRRLGPERAGEVL